MDVGSEKKSKVKVQVKYFHDKEWLRKITWIILFAPMARLMFDCRDVMLYEWKSSTYLQDYMLYQKFLGFTTDIYLFIRLWMEDIEITKSIQFDFVIIEKEKERQK